MKSSRAHALLASALLAGLTLTGCAADDTGGKPEVVASFYPLAYAAERVAGDDAEVINLTSPGVEPHDVELSPRQTAKVSGADVVVLIDGFQPALDAAARDTDAVVVDAGDPDFPTKGSSRIRSDDPHFWLDPHLVADLGDAVADALVATDPEHRDTYLDNAATLRAEMGQLDEAYDQGLARCERSTVVVSHDAFGYLDRYGLRFVPIAGLSPGAEPSVRHLAEISELIREDGITTVFSERLASPKFADTLAQDLGLVTAVLDPIEGLTEDGSDEDYVSLMQDNLAALRKAGGCT